jgi:hypothetical protein
MISALNAPASNLKQRNNYYFKLLTEVFMSPKLFHGERRVMFQELPKNLPAA